VQFKKVEQQRILALHMVVKMAFGFKCQLSDIWAKIERQLNSSGWTRFGHDAEIR
jgi:hypothetical protein